MGEEYPPVEMGRRIYKRALTKDVYIESRGGRRWLESASSFELSEIARWTIFQVLPSGDWI